MITFCLLQNKKREKRQLPYVFSDDLLGGIREIEIDEIREERHDDDDDDGQAEKLGMEQRKANAREIWRKMGGFGLGV